MSGKETKQSRAHGWCSSVLILLQNFSVHTIFLFPKLAIMYTILTQIYNMRRVKSH